MALRRPLVRILGKLRILPAEDKIPFGTVDELGTAAKLTAQTNLSDFTPGRAALVGIGGIGTKAAPAALTDFKADNPAGLYTAVTSTVLNGPFPASPVQGFTVLCTVYGGAGDRLYWINSPTLGAWYGWYPPGGAVRWRRLHDDDTPSVWSVGQTIRTTVATPLALERTGAAANVSMSFTTTTGTTYFGFGPATLGDLYVGTTPNLAAEGKKLLHTGNTFADASGVLTSVSGALTNFVSQLLQAANAAAARVLLELGTAATRNVMTSTTDTTTPNALMPRGAFGLGAVLTISNCDTVTNTGFYQVGGGATGRPPAVGALAGFVMQVVDYGSGYTMQRAWWPSPSNQGIVSAERWRRAGTWDLWEVATSTVVTAVTGSRALDATDAGSYLRTTAALTITVPTNATVPFPIGTEITVRHAGAGNVTLAPASGVTLIAPAEGTLTLGPRMTVTLKKVGTDTRHVIGHTVPA